MKILSFFILFLLPLQLAAQARHNSNYYSPDLYKGPYFWMTIGLGKTPNEFKGNHGLAAGIAPTVQVGKNVFSLRLLGSSENPLPVASSYYGYDEWLDDISILYGRCYKSARFFAAVSAGLGRVRGMRRGILIGCADYENCHYEEHKFKTIGLALESQLFIQAPIIGFGINLVGNINNHDSFAGFLISFQLGYTKKFLRQPNGNP
jgi:hypothetical protein